MDELKNFTVYKLVLKKDVMNLAMEVGMDCKYIVPICNNEVLANCENISIIAFKDGIKSNHIVTLINKNIPLEEVRPCTKDEKDKILKSLY